MKKSFAAIRGYMEKGQEMVLMRVATLLISSIPLFSSIRGGKSNRFVCVYTGSLCTFKTSVGQAKANLDPPMVFNELCLLGILLREGIIFLFKTLFHFVLFILSEQNQHSLKCRTILKMPQE